MKLWKVILASVVIFAAGAVTGALVIKSAQPVAPVVKAPEPHVPMPPIVQDRFLQRMKKELSLTPEQAAHFDKIFSESRERLRLLWDLIGPEVKAEMREVQDKVRAELKPEQRQRFEELLKERPPHRGGGPGEDRRRRPNPREGGAPRGERQPQAPPGEGSSPRPAP